MSFVTPVEYDDATPEVREIYDEILALRGTGQLSPFWKTLAFHPPTLRQAWNSVRETLSPGALDEVTKEMIYIAASVATNCDYCINAHIGHAKRLGMTDEMLGELMAVVSVASGVNRLGIGYGIKPAPDQDHG
ncbi:MAG: carboxymuconolactone decarboxylase family protein [Gammaproteobacteria bacterium]|nr:carboxymuconolactone decarboxylase family protein [Gammaproteobacteria bacterium]